LQIKKYQNFKFQISNFNRCGSVFSSIMNDEVDRIRDAVERDGVSALQALIGKDKMIKDVDLFLKFVCEDRDDQLATLLLDVGASLSRLTERELVAMATKSVGLLRRLLARGVNVSALRDVTGGSLCQRAIVNAKENDDDGDDSVDSVDDESLSLVRALVQEGGVDVSTGNGEGFVALHHAAMMRSCKLMHLVVELGADIDVQSKNGWTPLHVLCVEFERRDRGLSCLRLILALGADVHLFDHQGDSACHAAVQCVLSDVMCELIAAGSNVDQANSRGETPRTLAERCKLTLPTAAEIDAARKRIAKTRLDLVRRRATEVCVGLQPLNLDALQLCEIMMHSCGVFGAVIAFHQWWSIATKVKHFESEKRAEK
jgi:hypothetical protein